MVIRKYFKKYFTTSEETRLGEDVTKEANAVVEML